MNELHVGLAVLAVAVLSYAVLAAIALLFLRGSRAPDLQRSDEQPYTSEGLWR